jgi:predicted MFS family arabinose efflux permease
MSRAITGKRLTIALGSAQLLAWGSSYYLMATLGRPMARSFGVDPTWVYASFSVALLIAAFLGPQVGRYIDKNGGRRVLIGSNLAFAASLLLMAMAPAPWVLMLAWVLLGASMPLGLYDAAMATMVRFRGLRSRSGIVGITLIAGFASSVSWPLTALIEGHWGWRAACAFWALLHLTVGLQIHRRYIPRYIAEPPAPPDPLAPVVVAPAGTPPLVFALLVVAFTASGFVFAAMATHLPQMLIESGVPPAAAVGAAALVGVTAVLGRLLETGLLRRFHPLVSGYVAASLHPLGAGFLLLLGAPFAAFFAALHGAGIGLMTIVKGTLPLQLFGPHGFGRRAGFLEAPSRVVQAATPLLFGLALERFHGGALWITFAAGLSSLLALIAAGQVARRVRVDGGAA